MSLTSTAEKATQWLDPGEWYKDPAMQSEVNKNSQNISAEMSSYVGEGFGASDSITIEDPNERAAKEGLLDDDPFKHTDSSNSGILGGVAGGLMDITSLVPLAFSGINNDDANIYRGWTATANWLKGAGSKAEMAYYWQGKIPDGYEEDGEGNLKKKTTPVQLNGYTQSAQTGSGMS
jgi:hypothetical protein